jgi:hypothetical protein
MESWIAPDRGLPDEKEEVAVRVRGELRLHYYRIGERWYATVDIERWRMNTSPYWTKDRAWYLKTEQIDGWRTG